MSAINFEDESAPLPKKVTSPTLIIGTFTWPVYTSTEMGKPPGSLIPLLWIFIRLQFETTRSVFDKTNNIAYNIKTMKLNRKVITETSEEVKIGTRIKHPRCEQFRIIIYNRLTNQFFGLCSHTWRIESPAYPSIEKLVENCYSDWTIID